MDTIVIVFIVFMSFVSIMCVFAMLIVLRDLIENKRKRNDGDVATKPEAEPEPVEKTPDPVVKPESEVESLPKDDTTTDDTDKVVATFVTAEKKSLAEKYAELPRVYRSFYDEVANHAEQATGVTRHIKNDSYEEWKIGSARLVRLKIKKGLVIAEFNLQNSEMKEHILESKVDVKQSATVVKLEDHGAVVFVMDSIDLVVKVLADEKERKKAERTKARREKRKQEKTAEEGEST